MTIKIILAESPIRCTAAGDLRSIKLLSSFSGQIDPQSKAFATVRAAIGRF